VARRAQHRAATQPNPPRQGPHPKRARETTGTAATASNRMLKNPIGPRTNPLNYAAEEAAADPDGQSKHEQGPNCHRNRSNAETGAEKAPAEQPYAAKQDNTRRTSKTERKTKRRGTRQGKPSQAEHEHTKTRRVQAHRKLKPGTRSQEDGNANVDRTEERTATQSNGAAPRERRNSPEKRSYQGRSTHQRETDSSPICSAYSKAGLRNCGPLPGQRCV